MCHRKFFIYLYISCLFFSFLQEYIIKIKCDKNWHQIKQESLRVVTIAMIFSTLASLLWGSICNPVEHLWWSFYCKISKLLSIFTKSSIVDARYGSKYVCASWRLFKSFISLKYLHFKTLEICYFFKVLYFFKFKKHAFKHLIIKPFDLLNTIYSID